MIRFYGVMVSTQDSEFCDQSSNLSRTYSKFFFVFLLFQQLLTTSRHWSSWVLSHVIWPCGPKDKTSDYKSGDCGFESCQGQLFVFPTNYHLFLARHVLGLCNILKQFQSENKNNCYVPLGGLEPPTFRLTAQPISRLHHGGCPGHPVNLARSALSLGMANAGFPHSLGMCTLHYYHHSPSNSTSIVI